MKATLARTYGWTNAYIGSLPVSIAQEYYIASQVFIAKDNEAMAVAACVPNMKPDHRKKYFKELNKKIQSVIGDDNKATLSIEDAAKVLARKMMNG